MKRECEISEAIWGVRRVAWRLGSIVYFWPICSSNHYKMEKYTLKSLKDFRDFLTAKCKLA